MIKTIPFHYLRVDEYFTLSKQLLELIQKYKEEDPQLAKIETSMQAAINDFDQAYLKPGNKQLTVKVKEADEVRDRRFKAFRSYVEAADYLDKEEWENATTLLLETIKAHGWSLFNDSYSKETSRLNNLFSQIDTNTEFAQAIITIQAQEWYESLKEAQNTFEEIYRSRSEVNAAAPTIKTEDALIKMRKCIQTCVDYLQAMFTMEGSELYLSICNELNEFIQPLTIAVNQRKNKNVTEADV